LFHLFNFLGLDEKSNIICPFSFFLNSNFFVATGVVIIDVFDFIYGTSSGSCSDSNVNGYIAEYTIGFTDTSIIGSSCLITAFNFSLLL